MRRRDRGGGYKRWRRRRRRREVENSYALRTHENKFIFTACPPHSAARVAVGVRASRAACGVPGWDKRAGAEGEERREWSARKPASEPAAPIARQ
ncbi:hypothetical protein E2C01_018985 [Portunus trituberculatus]|uniref:Uncharacterized protein n=1 Tax=Portunus trituberculatus TaxID=210409 RepID=A0A5B7DW09_PORTR|nr:hypothetical protein [Portunus trituberculatus]